MATKNLFTGIKITFKDGLFDHSEYNKGFDRDGFRQYMLPTKETSVQLVERELSSYVIGYELHYECEFTRRDDGTITMYINSRRMLIILKEKLEAMLTANVLASFTFGSMKTDATFHARKY
jgi:hypothetical protein